MLFLNAIGGTVIELLTTSKGRLVNNKIVISL